MAHVISGGMPARAQDYDSSSKADTSDLILFPSCQ
jgi:hypothetical protein